jgi:predicted AAA+ superfamily ATPase
VIQELVRILGARPEELFFWATHQGAELDLFVIRGRRRLGFEVKRTTSPTVTRSMRSARETLGLDRIDCIHAGTDTYPMAEGFRAVSFSRLDDDIEPL